MRREYITRFTKHAGEAGDKANSLIITPSSLMPPSAVMPSGIYYMYEMLASTLTQGQNAEYVLNT